MTKKLSDELEVAELEAAATGPVRRSSATRRSARAKPESQARNGRRKSPVPGGIHMRSNKRIAW